MPRNAPLISSPVPARDVHGIGSTSVTPPSPPFELLIDTSPDAFCAFDRAWRFTFLSGNAERMLGPQDDLLGRQLWDVFPDAVGTVYQEQLDLLASRRVPVRFQAPKLGVGDCWWEVRAIPWEHGCLACFRDVTPTRRLEEEHSALTEEHRGLEEVHRALLAKCEMLRVEAEEASRSKTSFLAIVSHELRTPLSTIIGYADLLLLGLPEPLPELSRSRVERMRVSAWHLLRLVEEILSFARLEGGREHFRMEPVDLRAAVEYAVSVVEPAAREKGLEIQVDLGTEVPKLMSDAEKLGRMVLNLLSNAVKFTERGSVRVTLSRDREAGQILLRVTDTGIGIPSERFEQIFSPFWQIESTETRNVGGSGLGLSVARGLARRLGGDVLVESAVGVGSTFTLVLPEAAERR